MPTARKTRKKKPSPRLRVIRGGKAPREVLSKVSNLGNKYQVLFEYASDAVMTVNPLGKIDDVNEAFQELFGYVKTEVLGQSIKTLIPDQTKNRSRPLSQKMFQESGTYEDILVRRKDGFSRTVDLSVRQIEEASTSLVIALFRDVTEKKRMERELITKHGELKKAYVQIEKDHAELKSMQSSLVQAGKMAALGELAAGIAHEINQPLQGIRGYAQELQEILGHGGERKEEVAAALREIVSNVDKGAKIIHYLRTFTTKSVEDYEMVSVEHAIDESLKMLERQFRSRGIHVERKYTPGTPKIYANPIQLEQVFINLATNARDAIEANGTGGGQIWIEVKSSGDFVEVSYRDDGAGIKKKVQSKIFNPFFTTKEVGEGMGLGLSLSYGILDKIQGSIVVESELGKGTEFLIRLPRDFRELG